VAVRPPSTPKDYEASSARITGLTTVWDGSRVTHQALTQMLAATIEH
jgi:hypothetical protein